MDRCPALKDNFCSYHNRNSLGASLKRSHAIRGGFYMVYFCSYIYRCLIPGSFGHTRLDRVSGSPIVVGDDE